MAYCGERRDFKAAPLWMRTASANACRKSRTAASTGRPGAKLTAAATVSGRPSGFAAGAPWRLRSSPDSQAAGRAAGTSAMVVAVTARKPTKDQRMIRDFMPAS